jgi:L-2-hydroxyglutarate oxidase
LKNRNKDSFDCIIVGGGIVGLTTAFEYQNAFPDNKLLILEKESKIFRHQSGRNSGVIHSGIYYKPGTFKAKNCIEGYKLLIDFAIHNNIPYEITGKLIVAYNNNQIESLNKLYQYGVSNGLKNIKLLNALEVQKIEPYCKNILKALYVPQAGIIDYCSVGFKLSEIISEKGAKTIFNSNVIRIKNHNDEKIVFTNKGKISAKKVVLCTGVFSDRFLSDSLKKKFRIFPFKGEYFVLKSSAAKYVNGLIYPAPDIKFPFLGVHLTKTINQNVEAGPNAVLSFSRNSYRKFSFNWRDFYSIITWGGFWKFIKKNWKIGFYEFYRSLSKKEFTKSLQKLIPVIQENDLDVGKSGIRAQILTSDGELFDDFFIDNNNGIYNVVNAPSPAATSSFAIAKDIINYIKN